MKCPYRFPARSRKAMVAFMESIGGYYERPHRYPFSWNVKLPYVPSANTARTLNPFHPEGGQFAPTLDDAWQAEMESDGFAYRLIEDMRSGLDFYSVWPGVDQDQFSFSFAGRQGGQPPAPPPDRRAMRRNARERRASFADRAGPACR